MNDQVKAQLLQWLQSFGEALKTGAAFVQQQTPLVVQEKIAFTRIDYTAWVCWGLIMVLLSVYFLKTAVASWKLNEAEPHHYWGGKEMVRFWIPAILGSGFLVAGLCTTLVNLDTLVLVWFAPRVYILQWIMSGLK